MKADHRIRQAFHAVSFFILILGSTGCKSILNFSFSPNGKEVVLGMGSSADGKNAGIYLAPEGGGSYRRLTFPASLNEEDNDPVFSPDGSKIAFRRRDQTKPWSWSHLYLMNSDGSNLVRLTAGQVADQSPVFSPKGNTLYFLRAKSLSFAHTVQIFSISVDGSDLQQKNQTEFAYYSSLSISPDGENLLLTGYQVREGLENPGRFLHVFSTRNFDKKQTIEPNLRQYLSKEKNYAEVESILTDGRYSQDGKEIIFIGFMTFYAEGKRSGTGYDIYSYHVQEGTTEKIWETKASYAKWPVPLDNNNIYFCTGVPYGCDKLWNLNRQTRQIQEIKLK